MDSDRSRRWIESIAWTVCAVVVLLGVPTTRDLWMRSCGRAEKGTITKVEVTHDDNSAGRNYA